MDDTRIFEKKDLSQINSWAKARDLNSYDLASLPKFGIIVDNVAAGFLYETDSNIAVFESFISNPKSNVIKRGRALDSILRGLLEQAKLRGFKYVKGDTRVEAMGKRGERMGFKDLGYFMLYGKAL